MYFAGDDLLVELEKLRADGKAVAELSKLNVAPARLMFEVCDPDELKNPFGTMSAAGMKPLPETASPEWMILRRDIGPLLPPPPAE